ncbi:MAG: hypothetical protein GC179_24195 [Anaerolineaceae bacterium]|nr:hypothetical protein [Anaerolineaceae bacterium]
MKRFPPYMIVAVCGILFLSAGMVIITADSTDPSAQPTATVDIPTPTEIVSVPVDQPSQPVVVPTDIPPVVVPTIEPQVEVQPVVIPTGVPPAEVQSVVVPTEVVASSVTVPTEVVQPADSAVVVDQSQSVPNVQSQSVQQQAAPIVAGGQPEIQPTTAFEMPATIIPTDVNAAVSTPISQPGSPLGTLPPPSNVGATAESPVVVPNMVVATAQPTVQIQPTEVAVTQVTGQIGLPLRPDAGGIVVMLTLSDGSGLQTTTDSTGHFTFANLVPGTYRVDASVGGYLSSQTTFILNEGQTLVLPSVTLIGGDTNQDNKIDLTDAALVAANFDTTTVVAGADLNHDGIVDIRDLTAIGAYFGISGPTPWNS